MVAAMIDDTDNRRYASPPAVRRRAKELRWPMTSAEAALWERLRTKQLHGLKFRRQHPIDRFIVDFFCHAQRLVVEVDGDIHDEQREYDEARTQWLSQRGYRVLRFGNDKVLRDIDRVLRQIAQACGIEA
jgi:very-short-patch-repair endonuclease